MDAVCGDSVARRLCICLSSMSSVKALWLTQATIKAHSTSPLPARPYRPPGPLPVSLLTPSFWWNRCRLYIDTMWTVILLRLAFQPHAVVSIACQRT